VTSSWKILLLDGKIALEFAYWYSGLILIVFRSERITFARGLDDGDGTYPVGQDALLPVEVKKTKLLNPYHVLEKEIYATSL